MYQCFDELKTKSKPKLLEFFQEQKILYTFKAEKINDFGKKQIRDFVLTDKYIYNFGKTISNFFMNQITEISGYSFKRQINVKNVSISQNKQSKYFILHEKNQKNYLLSLEADKFQNFVRILFQLIDLQVQEYVILSYVGYGKRNNEFIFLKKQIKQLKFIKQIYLKENLETKSKNISQSSKQSSEKSFKLTKDQIKKHQNLKKSNFSSIDIIQLESFQQYYILKTYDINQIKNYKEFQQIQLSKFIQCQSYNNILKLLYAFLDNDTINMIYQFIHGGDLFYKLQQENRLSEIQAQIFTFQIIDSYEQLHQKEIVVGLMLPENILINGDFIYLSGFNNSFKYSEEKQDIIRGCKEYLSPEWIESAKIDYQSDIYNIGLLVYEMVIGRPPFLHQNDKILYELIQNGDIIFPSILNISLECQDFIQKCCHKDLKIRFQNIQQLKQHIWLEQNYDIQNCKKSHELYNGQNYSKVNYDQEIYQQQSQTQEQLIKQIKNEFQNYNCNL